MVIETRVATFDDEITRRIQTGPMLPFQAVAVALCVLLNMLDGYDVLSIAFAAPALAANLHLDPAILGLLLSAGPTGMALGAFFISPLGDSIGRRKTIIACLCILSIGMIASSLARTPTELGLMRVLTGAGIGGMLANINTVASEYASDRRRTLAINLMALGYPIGATIGGLIAVPLIADHGWRSVFLAGGLVSLAIIPVVLAMLPESVGFLLARQPAHALTGINLIRGRMGFPPATALPGRSGDAARSLGPFEVFRSGLGLDTLLLGGAFFFTMTTVYFAFSWMPKILVQMGLKNSIGIYATSLLNGTGVIGCLLFGLLSNRLGLLRLSTIVLIGVFACVLAFGYVSPTARPVFLLVSIAGVFLSAAIGVLYSFVPVVFPTALRASGAGIALSIGRCGAILGPFLAGTLIQHHFGRDTFCALLAIPALLATACLWAGHARRANARQLPYASQRLVTLPD